MVVNSEWDRICMLIQESTDILVERSKENEEIENIEEMEKVLVC